MAVRRLGAFAGAIRPLLEAGPAAGLTDSGLLGRFLDGSDREAEAAFHALVLRHAPMVRRVCRTFLRDPLDVEDAVQATFLVLAKRAGTLRQPDRLASWLYGVSLRAARRTRALALRPRHESIHGVDAVDTSERPELELAHREEAEALLEELDRLPAKYRDAVILCHLEGKTHEEAAGHLGCPPSTLSTRLTRARGLLRTRLTRRGVAPALGSLALAGATRHAQASARAAAPWAEVAGRTALAYVAGRGRVGAVPERIRILVEGVLDTMTLSHAKAASIATLTLGLLTCGGLLAKQAADERPPDRPPSGGTPAKAKAADPPGRDGPPVSARDASGPGRRYSELVEEYRSFDRWVEETSMAKKTEAERLAFFTPHWPLPNRYAGRFLELARAHPRHPAAFDSLAWIVAFGFSSPESDAAAAILARDWASDPRLWALCQEASRGPISLARGGLLRAIVDHSPDRVTRGRACFALAQFRKQESEFVEALKAPGVTPWQAQFLTEERLDGFRALDVEDLTREATSLYERAIGEFAEIRPTTLTSPPKGYRWDARKIFESPQDVEMRDDPPAGPSRPRLAAGGAGEARERAGDTLADLARRELEALGTVRVNTPAPEIDGEDIDGKRFRLSDYRGKVVLLTFSGNWCGPCRAMYPHERALLKRLEGRPFAILSVNTDEERETLRNAIDSGEITWRCWWAGSRKENPLVSGWGVYHWPAMYLLDAKGTVRHRFVGMLADNKDPKDPPMYRAVDSLLKEIEAGQPSGPRPPAGIEGP